MDADNPYGRHSHIHGVFQTFDGNTETTGPKISSCAMRILGEHRQKLSARETSL